MTLTVEEKSYWQSKGFVLGAQVRPTGTSWNASTSSRKWIGVVGVIVPGARSKSKGIPVQFTCPENQFHEVFVYHPTNLALVETKMPEEPEADEDPLYAAIQTRLETKDRETLHDRTTKAVEAVENLLEDVQSVEDRTIQNPTPAVPSQIPWSLDGLVVDPGEEAVGQWGFFWDAENAPSVGVAKLNALCRSAAMYKYQGTRGNWAHFAYTPNFPGAELLKRTTGYEAT